LINDLEADAPDRVLAKILDGLKGLPGAENLTLDQLKILMVLASISPVFTKVGPTIADDIRASAIWSTIVGLLVIFYISWCVLISGSIVWVLQWL
jgi:hypothetical protein